MSNHAAEAATASSRKWASSRAAGRNGVITAREIDAATSQANVRGKDVWLTDPGARGQGRFTIRCTPSGARVCMYRYTRPDGTRDILKVADYDPRGVAGMTLHEARQKAGEMARLAGASGNLRAALDAKSAAQVAAAAATEAEKRRAEQGSLAALFRIYASTLQGSPTTTRGRSLGCMSPNRSRSSRPVQRRK
jgi:hypothetical protein